MGRRMRLMGGDSPGKAPDGWGQADIWQFSDKYKYGGDGDKFLGSKKDLKKLVTG